MATYSHMAEVVFLPRYNRLGIHLLFVIGLLCACGLLGLLQMSITGTYYPILVIISMGLILPILLIPNRFPRRIKLDENRIIVVRFVILNLVAHFKDIVGLDESSIITTKGRIFYHLFRNADELFGHLEKITGSEFQIDADQLKIVELKEKSLTASILYSLPATLLLVITIPGFDFYPDNLSLFYFAILVFILTSTLLYFVIKIFLRRRIAT